jgi:heme oxygenase
LINSLLESLRDETKDLHQQTERALDLRRSCSSLHEYASLLQRLLGFYEPLEARLFDDPKLALPHAPDFETRRKTPALRADLEIVSPDFVGFDRCAYVPALRSPMARVGAWYVVEGATRGGAVIAGHLAKRLGLASHNGARFFDCYGAGREDRWDEFCGFLESIPAGGAPEVRAGAADVFQAMHRWLLARPARIPATA